MDFDDLSNILNATASAILLVDKSGTVLYCNDTVEDIFGLKANDLLKQHINSLLIPSTRQKHQSHFEQFFAKPFNRLMGQGASFPARHKSGKTIYISIGLSSMTYEGQDCVLATISEAQKLNDATQTIQRSQSFLDQRIEENKRLLRVVESSSDAVFLLNQSQQVTWVNHNALRLLEHRSRTVLHTGIIEFIDANARSSEHRKLATALENGQAFTGEVAIVTQSGGSVLIDCSVLPVFELDKLQGFVFTARDVTNRRRLEAQMRENSELLETTARIAQLGFYSLDIQTQKLEWSEEVYNIHELPQNAPLDVANAINYYAPEARPIITEAVDLCMQTGESFDLELPFITARGNRIWVRSVGYVEFKNGNPVKLKGAFQNISRLRQAASDAEQAALAKSNFLANMSHELRTPISGVIGMAEILSKTTLDKKQQEYVEAISQSGSTLLFLVNQVLDFAKLDSGIQKLNKRIFSLRQFLHEACYIHSVSANEKSVAFELSIDADVPDSLFCDMERLRQVLNNLCANAIKFTQKGKVCVHAALNESNDLVFYVRDTGIGIKADDIDQLFTEFQQVDNSYSRAHQGTGLGLTISKQVIDLLKGNIGVNSEFGQGSEFWFSLPLAEIESSVRPEVLDVTMPNTILLVADEISANFWAEMGLQNKLKLRACTRMSELLSEVRSDKNWEAIGILHADSDMPIDTCVAAILRVAKVEQTVFMSKQLKLQCQRLLEQQSEQGAKLVGLERVAQIDIDMNNQLSDQSPVFQQFTKLVDWFSKQANAATNDWTGKRILLAEDNEINQLLFTEMLADTSVSLSVAENGRVALDMLEASLEDPSKGFDLVIMDCQMPVMDGFEATTLIRQHTSPNIANVRICAATAHGFEEDIQRCYDVGMNDVMIKPFSNSVLTETISRNL